MMNLKVYSWILPCAVVFLTFIPDAVSSNNVSRNKPTVSRRDHKHGEQHYSPSKRDFVNAVNRENFADSQDQYVVDSTVASNQPPYAEIGRLRSDGGQQKMDVSDDDSYQNERGNPFGEAQVPTISSNDYKIAYSDGLPAPQTPTQRTSNSLFTYDISADPLEESNSNTVKIADPLANKKLFKDHGFSHGMGQLTNAINNILIDKVMNSDADKDFTKELQSLTEEFSEHEKEGARNDAKDSKHTCQPDAKSIFADCKKKRSSVCSPEDRKTFFKNALNMHNLFRKIHGVPDLDLNEKLSKDAQEYAEHLADQSSSVHSLREDRPGQGENIAVGCTSAGSELRAREAVSQWYSKACQKGFDFSGYKKGVEPFAQLVWKGTTYLGIGKAVSKRNDNLCTYIVARYSPEGDKNSFEHNVLKGTFSRNSICDVSCVVKADVPQVADSAPGEKALKEDNKAAVNASAHDQNTVPQERPSEQRKNGSGDQSSVSTNNLQSTPTQQNNTETGATAAKVDLKQNSENQKPLNLNTTVNKYADLKSDQVTVASKPSEPNFASNQHPSDIQPSEKLPTAEDSRAPSNLIDQQNAGVAAVLNKEPETKPPTLINITFPKELSSTNNSVIQITLGDNSLKQASALTQPTGFKPVVNFTGKDKQIFTADEEYFDSGDQNERFDEGKAIEKGPKLMVHFADDGKEINEFHGSSSGLDKQNVNKDNGFAKGNVNEHFDKQGSNVVGNHDENTMLSGNLDGIEINNGPKNEPARKMFQDRKGNEFKNRDDSETYLKIASKLMHRNGDGSKVSEVFLPKQLEKSESESYVKGKAKSDYGFTDEDVEELSKEKELGDLLAAVKNKTTTRENSTTPASFDNGGARPSETNAGNSRNMNTLQNSEANENSSTHENLASNVETLGHSNTSNSALLVGNNKNQDNGNGNSVLKNDSASKEFIHQKSLHPAEESSYMYDDKKPEETEANEILEQVQALPKQQQDFKYYSTSRPTMQADEYNDKSNQRLTGKNVAVKGTHTEGKPYYSIHEDGENKQNENVHNFVKDNRNEQASASREDVTTNKKFVKIIEYAEAPMGQVGGSHHENPSRVGTDKQRLENNGNKIEQQSASYSGERKHWKALEHETKQDEGRMSQKYKQSYLKNNQDSTASSKDISAANVDKANYKGSSIESQTLLGSPSNHTERKESKDSESGKSIKFRKNDDDGLKEENRLTSSSQSERKEGYDNGRNTFDKINKASNEPSEKAYKENPDREKAAMSGKSDSGKALHVGANGYYAKRYPNARESGKAGKYNGEANVLKYADSIREKLHHGRLGSFSDLKKGVDKSMSRASAKGLDYEGGKRISHKPSDLTEARQRLGSERPDTRASHKSMHRDYDNKFSTSSNSIEQAEIMKGIKFLNATPDVSQIKGMFRGSSESMYHGEDNSPVKNFVADSERKPAAEPAPSNLKIPATNIDIDQNAYNNITNIVKNDKGPSHDDKTATINVGNGFINIRYDKPKVEKNTNNAELQETSSTGSSNGISMQNMQGFSNYAPMSKNTYDQEHPHKDDAGQNVNDLSQLRNFDASLKDSEQHSITPVINRHNNHHYVIQFRPTHPSVDKAASTSNQRDVDLAQYKPQPQVDTGPKQADGKQQSLAYKSSQSVTEPTKQSVLEASRGTSLPTVEGKPQQTAEAMHLSALAGKPANAIEGKPLSQTEKVPQLTANGKPPAEEQGKYLSVGEEKQQKIAEGKPLFGSEQTPQATTEGKSPTKGQPQSTTDERPQKAVDAKLPSPAEAKTLQTGGGNLVSGSQEGPKAEGERPLQLATEGKPLSPASGKAQQITEGNPLSTSQERPQTGLHPQTAPEGKPLAEAKKKKATDSVPLYASQERPQQEQERKPQLTMNEKPVSGYSKSNTRDQASGNQDVPQEDLMETNSEAITKNLNANRPEKAASENHEVTSDSKSLEAFHSFSTNSPASKSGNFHVRPEDSVDIIKVDKNWTPIPTESKNAKIGSSERKEEQYHRETNTNTPYFPAERQRPNQQVGSINVGKESSSGLTTPRLNSQTEENMYSDRHHEQGTGRPQSGHLSPQEAVTFDKGVDSRNRYMNELSRFKMDPNKILQSNRLKPQNFKANAFPSSERISKGATIFQHPDLMSSKDSGPHSKYSDSGIGALPVQFQQEPSPKNPLNTASTSVQAARGNNLNQDNFESYSFNGNNLKTGNSTTMSAVKALRDKSSPSFIEQRKKQNASPAYKETSKAHEDSDEFELIPKMKSGPEIKFTNKDESMNFASKSAKLLNQGNNVEDSRHREVSHSRTNQNLSKQRNEGKLSQDDSVKCKSNCPAVDETSSHKFISNQKNADDVHSVIGFNLVEGSNVFSGVQKAHDRHSLDRITKKQAPVANLRHKVDRNSNHEKTYYRIFIPEEALVKFRNEMTAEHNRYRNVHAAPSLILSSILSKDSQMYASELALRGSVSHSPLKNRPNVGESIEKVCTKNGGMPSASDLLKRWYKEVCKPGYNFEKDEKQPGTGHFTQLVWKETKKLGIGLAASKDRSGNICSFVVARYYKAGNHLGSIENNVKRGSFHSCGDNGMIHRYEAAKVHRYDAGENRKFMGRADDRKYNHGIERIKGTSAMPSKTFRPSANFAGQNHLRTHAKSVPSKRPYTHDTKHFQSHTESFQNVNSHKQSRLPTSKNKGPHKYAQNAKVHEVKQTGTAYEQQVHSLRKSGKMREASGKPMSNIPTTKVMNKSLSSFFDNSKSNRKNENAISAIISIPNPGDFEPAAESASNEFELPSGVPQASLKGTELPQVYANHRHDYSFMYKKPKPKYLNPIGRQGVGKASKGDDEFEVNLTPPKFGSKEKEQHKSSTHVAAHISKLPHKHLQSTLGSGSAKVRPIKPMKHVYHNEEVSDSEIHKQKESASNNGIDSHKMKSDESLTSSILGLDGNEGLDSSNQALDSSNQEKPVTNFASRNPNQSGKPTENRPENYEESVGLTGSVPDQSSSGPLSEKQSTTLSSKQHLSKQFKDPGENWNTAPEFGTTEDILQAKHSSPHNNFLDTLSREVKTDGSYLSGMQAALDYDISQDKSQWEEPSATVPIADKLLKETSDFDNIVEPQHFDASAKAMDAEAVRMESAITNEGNRVESKWMRDPKAQFAASKEGIDSGSASAGRVPSVIMNEYNYDTPNAYGADGLYDRRIGKRKGTSKSSDDKGRINQNTHDNKVAGKGRSGTSSHANNDVHSTATSSEENSSHHHLNHFHNTPPRKQADSIDTGSSTHGQPSETSLSQSQRAAYKVVSSVPTQQSQIQKLHSSKGGVINSDEAGFSNGQNRLLDNRVVPTKQKDSNNKNSLSHEYSGDGTGHSEDSSNLAKNEKDFSNERGESSTRKAGSSEDKTRQSDKPNSFSREQNSPSSDQLPEESTERSGALLGTGFQQGFQDALAKLGDDDPWSKSMNVAAAKKGVLWQAPLLNDQPDTKEHVYRENIHGLNPEVSKADGYNSDSNVNGEKPSSLEMSLHVNAELDGKHEEKVNRDNHQVLNSDNVVKGETREILPNRNESYDSNRTRHFVIDRNDNLVLQPGEDDGAVSNFEQDNLAKLTEQATYGIGNIEKLAHDNQGMPGFQPPSVNSYEKANRPGLIAWTGPENPGLPDEETVKVNDYTGQSTLDSLEQMVDNGLTQLQAFEKSKAKEQMGNLERKPESVHEGVQSTEQLNSVLDSPSSKMMGNKISNFENSKGPIQKETAQDKVVSRLQFGKDSQNSKLEGTAKNDTESISDDSKMLHDASGGLHKAVIVDKVLSTKPKHNEDKSTFIQNALMWHNKLRCAHGSDRLRVNETLTKEADDYANHIVSKLNGILEHSKLETRHGEGENLAMTCSGDRSTLKGAEATFKWYNDICEKGYDFKSNIVQHGTGHFTQLVWKNTTEFGIGRATTKKNGRFCTVIVARYFPRGNIQKEFADNVNQGDYNDQTCETLEKDLMSDSKFIGCAKGSGTGVKSVHQNRVSNTVISNGKLLSLGNHPSNGKQKQKQTINQEIDRVSSLISKIEAEELAGNKVTGVNNHLKMPVDSHKIKGSPYGGHGGFVGLGGTGSPLVIYHGATGFFENPKAFANIGVETHNKLREVHGSPKVKLDMGLTIAAFQYATSLTQLGFLKHDEKIPKNQGENLMIGCYDNNSEMSAEDAVNRWYNEVCQPGYVFDNEVAESGTGHFSQVVWKATTKIGMAKQTRMHGNLKCTYIVARYSPAGNKHDEFKKNVNKGKFNEKVCQDVMRDLLKFQQRNENTIGKQEHDLKQEQAVAKLQGKVVAMMQNKAMQKEKEKQYKQPQASNIGSMQDMPSLGQPGIEQQLSAPFQRGSLFANASSQLPPSETSQLTDKYSSSGNNLQASTQHLKTMPSHNGHPTRDDDNVTLRPLGPTVKIVEQGDHGGIMFQRIENPKKVMKAKSQKFTADNISGGFMQNGLAGRISKSFEKSEKERPKVLQHRLTEKLAIHPDVDHVDIYGTVDKVSKSTTAHTTHSKLPTKISMAKEFEVPGETYRKTTSLRRKHLAKKPLIKVGAPQNTERRLSKETRRPLKRPPQAHNLRHIDESAVKIVAKPINGPSNSIHNKYKTVQAVRGKNSNFAAKSFAVNNNRNSGKSIRITSNKISSLPVKSIAPSRNIRPIQRNVNSVQRVADRAMEHTKTSSYVKPMQGGSRSAAASIKPRLLPPKLPSPFSKLNKLGNSVVQSKQKATLVREESLQKPLATPSRLNAGIALRKPVSFATETKQKLTGNQLQKSSIKNTNSLIHNNLKPPQAKPIAPALKSRPVLVEKKPGNVSTSYYIRPPNPVNSAVHLNPFIKTINAKSSSRVTKYRPVSAAMPLKPLMKPQSFTSPHPIKGPTAFDMKTLPSSPSQPLPYYVTTMESPTPQSYNPATVSKDIGQLITGEMQEDKLVFQRSALETHNKYRRLHTVPPLRMNYGMSVLAEQYARKIAQLGKLEHSGTEDGENIASVCRKDKSYMSGTEATNVWYSEICNPGYDFISGQPGNSGHFTQVVWKGTNQLGIGRAEAKRDGFICTFVVARYRPAGNFLGEFGKNVFRGAFDGSHCNIKKKDTIEFKHSVLTATTATPIKRSRIPRANQTEFSKKNGIFDTEEDQGSRSLHDPSIDDSVNSKANDVWLPDLESGFRGSDIAGTVPLAVSVGTDDNIRKYADQLMNDGGDEDKKLAENFAAELLTDVKKEQNAMTPGEKVKVTGSVSSNGNSKNMDINAARVAFGNMVASIKKSTPTVRYMNNSFDQTIHPVGQDNSLLKPLKTEAADSRSDSNVDASLLMAQVNQAAQSLSKAASSMREASNMQKEASNMQNNVVNQAQDENQITLQSALLNEELAKMAANMKVATASGPSNNGGSNAAGASNSGPLAPSASGFAAAPNGGSPQPAVGTGGDLASSNMATANQAALSQAAKDKKIESKNYKPSELEQSGLNAHNRLRSVHDAAPLVLNEKLSQEAAAWAQKCADLGIARRSTSEDGENVIESCKPRGQEMTASEATEIWYSELCNPGYDFDAAEITGAERFTQVVWKATTEMGIGKVTKSKGDLLCTYIVARYHPPGNILGDVKQNVRPGKISSRYFCKQFLAASKFRARDNSNLPSKIELMEQADSIGTTLEAGQRKSGEEIVAGADDPGMDGASVNKKEFRQEALYTHNRFRAIHLTPHLQMDVKLCQEAEQFAAYLASKGSLMRSKESKKGQNIAVSCNKDGVEMTGDEATNKWYNEVCNPGYDFKGSYPYGAAHFMQVVWASSKKFGIGKATTTLDDMLCTWVVGLYDPSGDMRNMQKENVLIGLFDYTYCDTFGKGGGGKGPSSGAIHDFTDNKISAPAGSSATAKKKSELETRLYINHGPKDKKSHHEELFAPLSLRASHVRSASNHHSTHSNSKNRTRYINRKKIRIKKYRKYSKKQRQNHFKLHHKHKRHHNKTLKRIT